MVRRVGVTLAAAAIGVVLWHLVALGAGWVRGVDFPTPWDTAARLWDLVRGRPLADHLLYRHLLDSLARWGLGFAIAAAAGVGYGLVAGWYRGVERLTLPLVHTLQLIPGLAWIPVALLLFGIGQRATVFMIAVTAFVPVAINALAGVKQVDETYVRAARMLGARGPLLLRRVLVPGALPHILSGLRTGLGNGWRVLVAAEMIVGAGTGLGYVIIQARWTLDYASALACVVVIATIGLVVERGIFRTLEQRTVERWGLPRSG
jgi:ABC-type nitrate/sulfonate/bicarbonate transport system permease component